MNLRLAPGLLEQLIEHSKKCYPQEGCGLIAGSGSPPAGLQFIPVANVKPSSSEYEMDPVELIRVLRDVRNTGQQLVAIFHSHPFSPAQPSKRDIERAYYPEAAHLIVSLAEPERPQAAAFRIVEGEVLEIEVHVIV